MKTVIFLSHNVDRWCRHLTFVVADISRCKINSLKCPIVTFHPKVNNTYNGLRVGHSLISLLNTIFELYNDVIFELYDDTLLCPLALSLCFFLCRLR